MMYQNKNSIRRVEMVVRIKTIVLVAIVFSLSILDATNLYLQLEKDASSNVKYSLEESKDKKNKSQNSMNDEMINYNFMFVRIENRSNIFKYRQKYYTYSNSTTIFRPPIS